MAIPLLTNPVFEVRNRDQQIVQGISQLSIEPHEWIEVEFEAEARGEGSVELIHHFELSKRRKPLRTTTRLEAGQTVHLRYTFASDLPISQCRIRTAAKLLEGDAVDLLFHRRRFLLRRAGQRPPQGTDVEIYTLDPPSEDPGALKTEITPIETFEQYLKARELSSVGGAGGGGTLGDADVDELE
jgi:hypothetical protein